MGSARAAPIRYHLAELRRARRVERVDRWLSRIGCLTRLAVYSGGIITLICLLWPHAIALCQSLAELALIDFLLIAGCLMGFLGVAVPGLLS
jgi:hypothetical protein